MLIDMNKEEGNFKCMIVKVKCENERRVTSNGEIIPLSRFASFRFPFQSLLKNYSHRSAGLFCDY